MVRKILLVNESAVMRRIVRTRIEANINDALVLEARDAGEALALVRHPGCHLVLSSSEVPGSSLRDLFKAMREVPATRPLPILLMTSSEEEVAARKAAAAGVSGYLLVPCSTDSLVAAVDQACSPFSLRQSPRYSVADTMAELSQRGQSFRASVINVSEGGALCQLDVTDGYHWAAPVMMSIDFSLDGEQVHVPGFLSAPVHINVIEVNPDYTPKRIRVAFTFINPPATATSTLKELFAKISED